jgi:hypothetical protein
VNAKPIGWPGNFTLGAAYQLDLSSTSLPATNDTCSTAVWISEAEGLVGSLDGTTPDARNMPCGVTYNDGWFRYYNANLEDVCVRVTVTPFINEMLALEVTDDNCGSPTSLACSKPAASGPVSLTFFVPEGETRMFRVANQQAGNGGQFLLDVTLVDDPGTFTDLGNGLAPSGGSAPVLSGSGVLCAGADVTLTVNGAVASSIGYLIVGLSEIDAPFQGGILVPSPDVFVTLPTNASGGFSLTSPWPAEIPAQFPTTMQYWVLDSAGVQGFAASNALRLTTP